MQEITCKLTSKSQVTVPKHIRNQLGVEPSDSVTFVVHDSGLVEVRPVRYTIESLKGIVPAIPGSETEDFDDLIAEAFEAGAKESDSNNEE